jgi:hypothetical protein
MLPIARFIKTHAFAQNSSNYTPTFTDGSGRGDATGSIGSWTPNWFAIHNPSGTAQSVTVWTLDQGTGGAGCTVYLPAGAIFYVNIAKITVGSGKSVTLFGTTNTTGTMI